MKSKFLLIALSLGFLLGCTVPSDRARSVLSDAGFTEINLGGYSWLACGQDDTFSREFSAVGPSGKRVHGTLCCGFSVGKGCTIRH